jgi:hypothetical protein
MKYIKLIGTELQNGIIMILKLSDSEPLQVQFAALYILYAVCIQTSVSIFVTPMDLLQMERAKCRVDRCSVLV